MKLTEPEPIKGVIEHVVDELKQRSMNQLESVIEAWDKAVGKKIKLHTRPASYSNNHLIVSVDSSNWLFELTRNRKGDIVKKLNRRLKDNKVKDITFKIGEIERGT